MNKLICCTLICIFAILPSLTNSQNNYLDKKLTLQKGHTTLKAALKQMSDQTGCVFSYDPTKIIDKQEIAISSKSSLTLRSALSKVLPKGIQYKTTGKYIVLQKATNTFTTDQPSKNTEVSIKLKTRADNIKSEGIISSVAKPINDSLESEIDTVVTKGIAKTTQPIVNINDTVSTKQTIAKSNLSNNIQTITFSKSDTVQLSAAKPKASSSIFALQVAANKHLATLSSHIGGNNIYGIISLGTDYYKSYHLGLGVGIYFQLYRRLGANIDVIQYALVGGKSKQINVKAYTTEISPALNYRIGNRLIVSLGPTVYSIRSRYSKGTSVTSLGRYLGYSGMFAISYNFGKI